MTVLADWAHHSWRHPYLQLGRHVPDVCAGSVVIAVGVAGITAHCWLRTIIEAWVNIHVLFGVLLCAWLTVRLRAQIKHIPAVSPREVTRQHSRLAYLVLYAVIGIKLTLGIIHALNGTPDPTSPSSSHTDDYQMCLAAGLAALVLMRLIVSRTLTRAAVS